MNKLMTVLTGVSVGLFLSIVLLQMQYEEETEGSTRKSGKRIKGNNSKAYGKNGTYQDQSKTGKGDDLINEGRTGNTD